MAVNPQNSGKGGNKWQVIYFGSVEKTGSVTVTPKGSFKPVWNPKSLEVDQI